VRGDGRLEQFVAADEYEGPREGCIFKNGRSGKGYYVDLGLFMMLHAVCCGVLQCVTVCPSVLQCVLLCVLQLVAVRGKGYHVDLGLSIMMYAGCCSELLCVLQSIAV